MIIDKASPVFSFEKDAIETELGQTAPDNKLTVQMYDGTVQYTSSNEEIATVDANGVVSVKSVDLQGRRMRASKPSKGVYVVNGKKVTVK